jgi:tripartite-type tricarboxylate transporter receptor subunit TctC
LNTSRSRMQFVTSTALVVTAAAAPNWPVHAASFVQPYPSRPIRWVVGFAPGGAPDVAARMVAPVLTTQIGQSIVIDNRPGANGILGGEITAKAQPDGYTMFITSAAFAINPSVQRSMPFDVIHSFVPVTNLAASEALLLAVNPTLPATTVQELVALAKKAGAKFAYGSSGVGNATHLAGALFAARTGTQLTHVPYKGGGPVAVALMSGEVQMVLSNPGTMITHIRAGRMRALAYNAQQRSPLMPNVPTMIESGVQGMDMDPGWYGVFAPAKTPAAIVNTMHAGIRNALAVTTVRDSLQNVGLEPVGNSPAEFKVFVERAVKRSAELVKFAGLKAE